MTLPMSVYGCPQSHSGDKESQPAGNPNDFAFMAQQGLGHDNTQSRRGPDAVPVQDSDSSVGWCEPGRVDARGILESIFPLIAGGLRRKWSPSAFCASLLVAPVIARTKGRRRAGQGRDSIGEFGAAKRTLDAPEPSRRISHRSEALKAILARDAERGQLRPVVPNLVDDNVRVKR